MLCNSAEVWENSGNAASVEAPSRSLTTPLLKGAGGMATAKRTPEQRFWDKVQKADPGECWLWIGAKDQHGYGRFARSREAGTRIASRISYELHHGVSVPAGMEVMHSCDNPPCVNPAHLSMGTPSDNQLDCVRKGRRPSLKGIPNPLNRGELNGMYTKPWTRCSGEAHPMSKFTADDVADIRQSYATGETGWSIYKRYRAKYGIGFQAVYKVLNRSRWK
jgi:hypothetical protein